MIQLTNQTSIALFIVLMKKSYGQSWYTDPKDGFFQAGIHSPKGEIAFKLPAEYEDYLQGSIRVPEIDADATQGDSTEALLKWSLEL